MSTNKEEEQFSAILNAPTNRNFNSPENGSEDVFLTNKSNDDNNCCNECLNGC